MQESPAGGDPGRPPDPAPRAAHVPPTVRSRPYSRAVRFWVPVTAMAAGITAVAFLLQGPAQLWAFLAVYHAPFGAYTAVPAARALGFSLAFVLAFMAYLRIFGALFFVWNMHWLRGLPWVGARVQRAESRGRDAWQRRPWLRRTGLTGLAAFVFLPLAGTGLVMGAIVGRLAGFGWLATWTALCIGALAQLLSIALVVYAGWSLLPWG